MVTTRPARFVRFETIAQWVLGVVFVSMSILMLLGSSQVAINSDEMRHVMRMQNFLDNGHYLPFYADPVLDPIKWNMFAYGPMFSLVAHIVTALTGAEPWNSISETADAYNTRHVVVVLFGIGGALAVGYATRLVTQSRLWGLFAAVTLLALPMYVGNSMSNTKDGPAAAGFAALTAGFIALAAKNPDDGRLRRILRWTLLILGTLFTIGIRPGLWPAVIIDFVALFVMTIVLNGDDEQRWRIALRRTGQALAGFGIGYAILALIYPVQVLNPLEFFRRSVSNTTDFQHDTVSTTNGVTETTPFGRGYLTQWIMAKTPDIILVVVVLALLGTLAAIVYRIVKPQFRTLDTFLPAATFSFIQIVAFPLAAVLFNANVYGGMRQFVFILPGMAILFTVSVYLAWDKARANRRQILASVTVGVAGLGVALPVVSQVQMFPYSTDYFNVTTSLNGINDRWDVDRWRLGMREVLSTLTNDDLDRCQRLQVGTDLLPCRTLRAVAPYSPLSTVSSESTPVNLAANEYIDPFYPYINDTCRKVSSIGRWNLFTWIDIERISACPIHVARYFDFPTVTTDRADWWSNFIAWGWSTLTPDYLESAPGQTNALGFAVPPQDLGHDLTISWAGTLPYPPTTPIVLHVMANDVEVYTATFAEKTDASGTATVPAAQTTQFWDGSLIISFEFTDKAGNPINDVLRLTNFSLAQAR